MVLELMRMGVHNLVKAMGMSGISKSQVSRLRDIDAKVRPSRGPDPWRYLVVREEFPTC